MIIMKKAKMKNRIIWCLSIASIILGGIFGWADFSFAQSGLDVVFNPDPMFSKDNFMPGETASASSFVTNTSGQPQRIAAEAINVIDPHGLSDGLSLTIKEGGNVRYDNSLAHFFNSGEVYLSDLSTGQNTRYDFLVRFDAGSESPQGAELGFDIIIGFQGVEGRVEPGAPPSGGGGSGGYSGLTISYGKGLYISTSTALITWLTSYQSSSRVVYGTDSGVFDLTDAPNYGYPFSSAEFDTPASVNGVVAHEVLLTGLTPNTTYYYRVISHASPPTISREYHFTTLALGEAREDNQEEFISFDENGQGFSPSYSPGQESGAEEGSLAEERAESGSGTSGDSSEQKDDREEAAEGEEKAGRETFSQEQEKDKKESSSLLAFLGGLVDSAWGILALVLIPALIILWLIKKRRE